MLSHLWGNLVFEFKRQLRKTIDVMYGRFKMMRNRIEEFALLLEFSDRLHLLRLEFAFNP
jgi:hypothetical protein